MYVPHLNLHGGARGKGPAPRGGVAYSLQRVGRLSPRASPDRAGDGLPAKGRTVTAALLARWPLDGAPAGLPPSRGLRRDMPAGARARRPDVLQRGLAFGMGKGLTVMNPKKADPRRAHLPPLSWHIGRLAGFSPSLRPRNTPHIAYRYAWRSDESL
jgi:hypothetical protein